MHLVFRNITYYLYRAAYRQATAVINTPFNARYNFSSIVFFVIGTFLAIIINELRFLANFELNALHFIIGIILFSALGGIIGLNLFDFQSIEQLSIPKKEKPLARLHIVSVVIIYFAILLIYLIYIK